MIRIKKWICTLALLTISLTTINRVNAQNYIADNTTIINSSYTDMFKNYFGENKSYIYFTYKCYYGSNERNCYYAIDDEFNYISVTYNGSGYSYIPVITTGIDKNFIVSGLTFNVKPSYDYVLVVGIGFIFGICICYFLLWRLWVRKI